MQIYTCHLLQGILVVYDVTHKPSFESLPDWLEIINEVRQLMRPGLVLHVYKRLYYWGLQGVPSGIFRLGR